MISPLSPRCRSSCSLALVPAPSGPSRSHPTSSNRDRRRQDEGAWSKVVMHTTPSTNKFEIKQYLSKVYNLDVKKVRAALWTRQPAIPARRRHPPADARPRRGARGRSARPRGGGRVCRRARRRRARQAPPRALSLASAPAHAAGRRRVRNARRVRGRLALESLCFRQPRHWAVPRGALSPGASRF